MEQKFSSFRVMAAANHSKNSAMEAENHVKYEARSKSLIMSRMSFLRTTCLIIALVAIIISCKKDDAGNSVQLLETVSFGGKVGARIEYDNDNRITKLSFGDPVYDSEIFAYNSMGDLISIEHVYVDYPENNRTTSFSKNGNIITVTGDGWNQTIEINSEGLPVKYGNGVTFEYKDDNLIKRTWQSGGGTFFTIFTYDNKKSLFHDCKTSKWWLYDRNEVWISKNNLIRSESGNHTEEIQYTYNAAGYPLTMKYGDQEESYTYIKR